MRPMRPLRAVVLVLFSALPFAAADTPPPDQNLVIAAPIRSWDEGLPLGNGLTGGLLWGEKNILRVSLDRGDLWDERPAVEREWWKKWTWEKGGNWDAPYQGATPTKLPAGRLEVTLGEGQKVKRFELNFATAEGIVELADGAKVEAFYSATQPVALARIPGAPPKEIRLRTAGSGSGGTGPDAAAVAALGYPKAQTGSDGDVQWFLQEAAEGLKYCACVGSSRNGNETLLAFTVTSTKDGADPVGLARQRVAAALKAGYAKMLKDHAAWWREFWSQSSISIPEPAIQNYCVLARYLYGAGSRRGAPPMPLQGVWTADAGSLPPWKGDYHNDLNTQMTYIGYHATGNFDEGACYLDFLWDLAPAFRAFAKDFYGTPGLSSPGVMSLAGQPLGGWGMYSLSPTMTSWNAHLFYLHWRYTMDETFLRERAYPWCREAGECVRALLKKDAEGLLKLPKSSSPEIFDNSGRAWLLPNSNYDLMCMKMQFLALAEMADALGRSDEARSWAETAAALGGFHADASGMLLVDAKTPLPYSHRHLSNIIGIFPFNLVTAEGGDQDRRMIEASLAQWDKLGTGAWCGYSFAWMSGLRARVGDAEAALRHLDIFVKAFVTRNGFHVNGDQTGSGFSGATYRPFTLEGNFAALRAAQEMLLQSWSPTPGKRDTEIVRIFPATPWRWHDVEFSDLRAEGGWIVSARRENNATTWFRVTATRDGLLRIRDNFGGRIPEWDKIGAKKVGDNYEAALTKGRFVEASLTRPDGIPPAPANAAEPVVIRGAASVAPTTLPLRIGADSGGGSLFAGEMARVAVFGRPLSEEEIAGLADKAVGDPTRVPGLLVAIVSPVPASVQKGRIEKAQNVDGLPGPAFRFDGSGYLEVPHEARLNPTNGLTLAAWVRPAAAPALGMRIVDKTRVGTAAGYLLDTYPSNSLRLITRDPHLIYAAHLPTNQWTHVAATVDGATGWQTLYVNGEQVASQ
jgi:alpha-L-fucosidase 2